MVHQYHTLTQVAVLQSQVMPEIDWPLRLQKPRTPVRKKRKGPPRRGRMLDPDYLAWIGTLPCVVCYSADHHYTDCWLVVAAKHPQDCWMRQESRTEAAHVGPHGMSQKTDDENACPLCKQHHTEGKESLHKLGPAFWAHHGIDWPALKAALRARYDAQR